MYLCSKACRLLLRTSPIFCNLPKFRAVSVTGSSLRTIHSLDSVKRAIQREQETMHPKFDYPIAHMDETVVEKFHDKEIKDIYRWLEDPDAEATKAYVDAQNKISQPYLEDCDKRAKFNAKLTKVWDYPKYSCPMQHGKYYYYYMNTGLQNQSVLYQQKSLNGQPKVFLDPNTFSDDGTIALAQQAFSDNGQFMAYGLSESGSDWVKIRIRDVETGKDFDEVLEKVKFSAIAWTKDNKGFFYGRYPDQDGKTDGSETQQNEYQKLYYHRISEPQDKDVLVVEFPEEPTWRVEAEVSDDGAYLIMPIVKDCRDNMLYYADLRVVQNISGKLKIHKVIDKFESDYDYITNIGSKVFLRTNKNAPNYRVIVIDFENPAEENWTTLIPEHEKDVLDWAKCVDGDKVLLCYMHDVKSALQANSLSTGELLHKFELDIGTIAAIAGDKKYSEIFFKFTSFLIPGTIFRYDFKTPDVNPSVFREIKLNLENFEQRNYKVEQIFYRSKDNTEVPMFIVRKNKDVVTPRPCLLYGYGGFNISIQPSFSITGLVFVDTFDGVLAYPNIRGGGEYGEKWHNAGRLLNKQNVFDDFQAAAQYLIENQYTTKDRLVIQGGSNGGLLVGACINQRPDLFGAAVAQVGVMDMLRFHKFTIGHAWCSDYGNPCERDHFENLLQYSPLHNVRTPKSANEEYPSTLILTADHDDRVSPLHSLKFAAALQKAVHESEFQKNPILLRVYTKAGHGAGKPTTKRIEESTDIITFMYKTLNIETVNL